MPEKIWEKNFPEKRRPEYLKEGVKRITACIGTPEQFQQYPSKEKEIEDACSDARGNRIHNIDFYGDVDDLNRRGFENAGHETYVISPVDDFDKFSETFRNCTGLVAAGQDKKTGKNISFMSHEDPVFFLLGEENKSKFINDLWLRLKELHRRSVDKTIDAVIIGGNYTETNLRRKDYVESIRLLSEEVKKSLGFEPVVIAGPKITGGKDDVFYDNEHRRIYIMRPQVGKSSTESFYPSELGRRRKEWEKESEF